MFNLQTVIATALVVMVAGYDTTAQTMSWMAYELARNKGKVSQKIVDKICYNFFFPDIQQRLQSEIDVMFEEVDAESEFPDYYSVQGLEYMDQVKLLKSHTKFN